MQLFKIKLNGFHRTVQQIHKTIIFIRNFDAVIKYFIPHRSTMYVDAAYCYRPSSVVCRSVTVVSPQRRLNRSRCRFGSGLGWAQGKHELGEGAHCRHLANIIEPSMCGCDAACCQITLTTSISQSINQKRHYLWRRKWKCTQQGCRTLSNQDFLLTDGDSSYNLRVVGPTNWPLAYCKYSFFTLKLVELIITLNGSKRTELNKNCTIIFSYFSAVFGNWTTRGYTNSRIANLRTGQLAVLQMPPKERKLSTQLAVAFASCPVTQFSVI